MIRITYFRHKCIGCGGCVEAAPHRWRMSKKDGKCTLIGSSPVKDTFQVVVDKDELSVNEKAAANCPVNIIRLHG